MSPTEPGLKAGYARAPERLRIEAELKRLEVEAALKQQEQSCPWCSKQYDEMRA